MPEPASSSRAIDSSAPASPLPAFGPEPDDERPDVADRRVQAVDRPVDPFERGRPVLVDELGTSSSDRLTA